MEIKKIGSLHPLDKDGYILNPCIYPVVQPEYAAVVDWILNHCRLILDRSIHSMYLRGSVAKGQAIRFVSDIDTLLVTQQSITENEMQQVHALLQTITTIFPFVAKAEIMTESLEQTEKSWLKFLLKTQCVCIYGTDLIPAIEPFKVGKEARINSLYIVNQITELEQELETLNDPGEIKEACTWIMKAIIRSGFELVMERDQSYTRDLYPNYERFSTYYPEKEAGMRRVLTLAIEPTDNKETICEVIFPMKQFMLEQIKYLHG